MCTLVDTGAPIGAVVVNSGARASTVPSVTLTLSANDLLGSVSSMRFSPEGTAWTSWQPYASSASYTLSGVDGEKAIYAQFRDAAGNVSTPVSATIRLDQDAGTKRLVSLNNGDKWTNGTAVTLTIGAPAGTTEMQLSNDGGFRGTSWQPFDTRPNWTIDSYGAYVLPRTVYVRVRGTDGAISDGFTDDIIFDPVPPTGTVTTTLVSTATSPVRLGAATSVIQVSLSATDPDNLSGVAAMRVGLDPSFGQTTWGRYATSTTIAGSDVSLTTAVYAQFRDGAGNVSSTVCSRPDGGGCLVLLNHVSLPAVFSQYVGGW